MTSESLYKSIIGQKCDRYISMVIDDLVNFDVPVEEFTGDLRAFKVYQSRLEKSLNEVIDYHIPSFNIGDISGDIRECMLEDFIAYKQQQDKLDNQAQLMLEQARKIYHNKCQAITDEAQSVVSPLKQKHEKLLSYRDKLSSVMEHYGITSVDTHISAEISREEFEALLDSSINICMSTENKLNGLISKIIKPVLEEDDGVAIGYAIVGLLASWLLLPVIGVVYVSAMIKNTKSMYSNLEALRIAESLMHSVDFNRFIPKDEKYDLPVYDDSDVQEYIKAEQDKLAESDPSYKLEAEIRAFKTTEGVTFCGNAISATKEKISNIYTALKDDLQKRLTETTEIIEAELSKVPRLGDAMNKSAVLDTNFTVGIDEAGLPISVNYGLTNLNIVGTYSPEAINYIKILWLNMLLNVRANCLETTIYDAEYLGQEFAEFITNKTAPYIRVVDTDCSKLQSTMRKETAASLMKVKNNTILDYNKEAEEQGMMTQSYKLFIYLSGLSDKYHEDKVLMELSRYSATAGVFIWTIYPREIPGCVNIKLPISIDEGRILKYDFDLGTRSLNTFSYDLDNNKIKALDYRTGYLMKYLPPEKWWTGNTISGVNIRMGLQDGDPSKPYTLRFDDKNVHYLMCGATGAGKSVAIDCALQSMIHEYPPDELQLIYVDMKNSEVSKYTTDGISNIPHSIIMSGTEDGEYCLSIFDWMFKEMKRRLEICSKYKVQKVEDLRKKFDNPSLEGYNPEVHIPRIILLVDEFQVMFDTSRLLAKIIDMITGRITSAVKLARAASIHLWFTSQEMTGTLAKNVLDNFSNRGALRCTKEVSATLIGNEASGTIRDKVGWMYTNTSAGQDPNANQLWKVPFAPIDDLLLGISELCDKAEAEGKPHYHAPFYDEKLLRNSELLRVAYDNTPEFNNPRFFVMGERTTYSVRTTPLNFTVEEDDKENIFICAAELQDYLDLIGTVLDNIRWSNGKSSLLMNCTDKDTIFLLDLDSKVEDSDRDFLAPTYSNADFLEDLNDIYDYRASLSDLSDLSTLYVVLIAWEKRDGVGQSEDYKITAGLKDMILKLNALKVHFIFISREIGGLREFINLCKHRICAKTDERSCTQLIDDTSPFKFPAPTDTTTSFATYKYGSDARKFKIYRYSLERELEAREL